MSEPRQLEKPALERSLTALDGALLTVGSIVGTGIFLTTGDVARAVPHAGLVMLVWVAGGFLTLAGALTYAELGAMFPRAGGLYHFLKEAYGPIWGFLYGWASFWVIFSGGIAAIAAGFGEYLGSFLPWFSTSHVLASADLLGHAWKLTGGQIAAVVAIAVLTAVNYGGLKSGAFVQNVLTALKIGSLVILVLAGLLAEAPARPQWQGMAAFRPDGPGAGALGAGASLALLPALGVGMIAVLWTWDGWYGLTFSAGEMKDPRRDLPRALVFGTALVMVLYAGANLVYLRVLPIGTLAETSRVGEAAATALFGEAGARVVSLAILVSILGCLSSTILYTSRLYQPMAEDGVFFRSLATIHPTYHTPSTSLVAQSAWAVLLTLSGSFDALYTYVVFAGVVFHAGIGFSVIVLRRKRPELERPYLVPLYPAIPLLFVLASLLLMGNTLVARPVESLWGLLLVAAGLPAYAAFVRARRPVP